MHIETESDFNFKKMWPLLKHCTTLKVLKLKDMNVNGLWVNQLNKVLPNLVALQFVNCSGNDFAFARIINACKNLNSLIVSSLESSAPTISLLEAIAQETSKMQILIFTTKFGTAENIFLYNLAKLKNLKNLISLGIKCSNYRIAPAINDLVAMDSLKRLWLLHVTPDEDLAIALKKFKNLEKCSILTQFEMRADVRKSFDTFIYCGKFHGQYKYRFTKHQSN